MKQGTCLKLNSCSDQHWVAAPGKFQVVAKILDRFFVDREPGGEFVIRNARNLLFHIRLDGAGILAFLLDPPDFVLEIEQPQFFHFDHRSN